VVTSDDRPRDNRLPDLGVVSHLPPGLAAYSNLPGSAFSLVIEIVSEHSENGQYTDKAVWYAQRGIPDTGSSSRPRIAPTTTPWC
jgi:hypothetical protein